MKYLGTIQDPLDLVTKKYVDDKTLPEVTSADNGKALTVQSGVWAAGNISGTMVVTLTSQGSGSYTADKTFAEIYASYHNKNTIYAVADAVVILKLDYIDQMTIVFRYNAVSGDDRYGGFSTSAFVIKSDDSVELRTEAASGSFMPDVDSEDNGKAMQVVNGEWELTTPYSAQIKRWEATD